MTIKKNYEIEIGNIFSVDLWTCEFKRIKFIAVLIDLSIASCQRWWMVLFFCGKMSENNEIMGKTNFFPIQMLFCARMKFCLKLWREMTNARNCFEQKKELNPIKVKTFLITSIWFLRKTRKLHLLFPSAYFTTQRV